MPTPAEVAQVLARGQAKAESLMLDTCRITKPGVGKGQFNESTGQYDAPDRIPVYEGPCRLQVKADINSNVVETTAGEREWTYLTAQLQLPVTTPASATGSVNDVDVDYVCEVLTSPFSPSLVGTLFNIQGTYHKSQAVYLRFRVREVVA